MIAVAIYMGARTQLPSHGPNTTTALRRDKLSLTAREAMANVSALTAAHSLPANPKSEPLKRTVVHEGRDLAGSRFGDLVVADGIRLGREAVAAPRTGMMTGSYFSPVTDAPLSPREQMDATFDKIAFSCAAVVPPGSTLTLEFRTIAYADDGEGWSEWREISLKHDGRSVSLGELAQTWQYRITLAAEDSEKSPVVRSVTVTTEQDPTLADAAFAFARRAEARVGATQ